MKEVKANIKVDAIRDGESSTMESAMHGMMYIVTTKAMKAIPPITVQNFLEKGNCLIDALKLALVLCGSVNGNKVVDDLKVQIYNNLIHIQTDS